jgi:polyribonucleotide nucleotidyltransferase
VHISELADFRVNKTEDICKLGDEMVVKCIGVEKGKVRLSRKAALEEAKEEAEEAAEEEASEAEETKAAE